MIVDYIFNIYKIYKFNGIIKYKYGMLFEKDHNFFLKIAFNIKIAGIYSVNFYAVFTTTYFYFISIFEQSTDVTTKKRYFKALHGYNSDLQNEAKQNFFRKRMSG